MGTLTLAPEFGGDMLGVEMLSAGRMSMADLDDILFRLATGPKPDPGLPSRPSGVVRPEAFARFRTTWAEAVDVWGDEDTAQEFLRRPHAMLNDRRPIDVVLESDEGARSVEEILGRLKYGSAA